MPLTHQTLFPLGPDATAYRKLTSEGARLEAFGAHDMLTVDPEAIRLLAEQAFIDINLSLIHI